MNNPLQLATPWGPLDPSKALKFCQCCDSEFCQDNQHWILKEFYSREPWALCNKCAMEHDMLNLLEWIFKTDLKRTGPVHDVSDKQKAANELIVNSIDGIINI